MKYKAGALIIHYIKAKLSVQKHTIVQHITTHLPQTQTVERIAVLISSHPYISFIITFLKNPFKPCLRDSHIKELASILCVCVCVCVYTIASVWICLS